MTAAGWAGALRAADYVDVLTLANPEQEDPCGGQTVVVGRAPEQVAYLVATAQSADMPDVVGRLADRRRRRRPRRGARPPRPRLGRACRPGAHERARGSADGTTAVHAVRLEDYDPILASVPPAGVVLLWNQAAAMGEVDGPELDRAMRAGSGALVDLVQALERRVTPDWPRLFVLTRGAHAFRNDQVRLDGA